MSDVQTRSLTNDPHAHLVEKMMSAVKTGALYGQEHPQRRRLMADAHTAFRALETDDGVVTLEVTPEGLEVSGVLVDVEDASELARRINSGGVRRLELSNELELEELDGLASLMALDFDRMRLEDDLTTLLWEKNWPHVAWEAFEVPSDETETEDEASGFNSSIPDDPPMEPLSPKEWAPSDFALTTEESEQVSREVAVAEADPPIAEVGAVLCQVVALEKNVKHIGPILESLRALVDRCLRTGEFAAAGATAHLLDRFGKDPESLTDEKLRAIQQCQASFVSAESIEAILPVLEEEAWDSPDAAVAFLTKLPSDAVPLLLDAYFTLRSEDARAIARRALVAHLGRDLRVVSERLSTFSVPALLEIVRLLGDVESKETVSILKETLRSGASEVRLVTIDALATAGGPHARTVLTRALSDDDRDVRCRAAHALASMGTNEALEPLLREMLQASFRNRDLGERLTFFRALGSTNAPEVLPFLKRLLQRRGWAFLGRRQEERRCAAAALTAMTHPDALALRAELMRSGAKDLPELFDSVEEDA